MKFNKGEIVRIKDPTKYRIPYYKNIFKVIDSSENSYTFEYLENAVPANDVEAVPIDGVSDKRVYYNPIVNAAYLGKYGGKIDNPPLRKINYTYYWDILKKDSVTYNALKEKNYEFVHEVQQFLKNQFSFGRLEVLCIR